MQQYVHNKFLFFEFKSKTAESLSAPVEEIVPLEVVRVVTGSSGVITIEFELLQIPEFDEDEAREDDPKLLFRATRLFARAEILRFRSSRSNDFSGDT